MSFTPGSLVFYDDSEEGPLEVRPLPDQRVVMTDIPQGATRVVVVAPVWRPAWRPAGRFRRRLSALLGGRRTPSR